jgi:DNA-binding NarL/FixJ family response regulator
VLQRLVRRAVHARSEKPAPIEGLTARERDVLDLVAEGLSNTEIADRLHIGVTTVKTHITSLMTKTNSPNRVRLALFAHGRA